MKDLFQMHACFIMIAHLCTYLHNLYIHKNKTACLPTPLINFYGEYTKFALS